MNSIDIIPWDDNFNTGIKIIDNQHKKLVDIINSLAGDFAFNAEKIDLNTTFNELIDYTNYHFATEEGIWNEYIGDDESEEKHSRIHKNFIEKLTELIEKQKEKEIEEVAENTLDFLIQWLISHILESDREMAYTVDGLQHGMDLERAETAAHERMSGHNRKIIDLIIEIYKTLSHNNLRLMRKIAYQNKIEKELETKERLLKTVIDEIPDILVLKDSQGNFLLGNRAVADFYKTTPDEMVGKDDSYFGVPKDISEGFKKNIISIMEQGKAEIVYEDSRDANSGEIRHFKSIKRPIEDINGDNQILVIAQDITDEIAVQEKLKDQREFLESLIHALPDLVWLKDPQGVYLACNNRLEQFFGATEEEIVGKSDYDFVDKELADFFREHDKNAMANEKATINEEWITFANDGHKELLETIKTPMYDTKGGLIGVLGVGRNVTERKENEVELRRSEEKLNRIYNSQKDISVITDGKRLIDANRAFLNFFHYDSVDEFKKEYDCICDFFEGDGFEIDFERLTKEDKDVWAQKVLESPEKEFTVVMKDHIFNIHGQDILANENEFIFNFIDISDSYNYQKRLEYEIAIATEKIDKQYQELIITSKKAAMGELIGVIAHQLKQPINAISLSKDLLVLDYEDGRLDKEKIHSFENSITKHIHFMVSSIDDLKNFFRPDKKKHKFSVKSGIEKAVSILSTQISSNGIEIKKNYIDDVEIIGVENEIQQVILNLFTNAKEALIDKKSSNPHIKLELFKENEKVVITVEDNGGGIPESILGKVFDSYFTTKGEKGTGIGLNLSKMIVEESLGGEISVENLEKGARFRVEFPLN